MNALLQLKEVSRRFGDTLALDQVNLTVKPQVSCGIVGESGAGKSTILNLLLGLDHPTNGSVCWQGESLNPQDRGQIRAFRRQVQAVFQDPRSSLDPRMKVGNIIAEPLRSLKIPGNHKERVSQVLQEVGLEAEMATRFPGQFSGGQRQRIAIARALAPKPGVLIADEPVSALDVSVKAGLIELLHELKRSLQLTIIMVSHDIAIVGQLCENIVVLKDGKVVESGPTKAILENPGQRYTSELLAAIPTLRQKEQNDR
jgi:ATPase components of various ABC-type transport systems, contain duplicated ATPase